MVPSKMLSTVSRARPPHPERTSAQIAAEYFVPRPPRRRARFILYASIAAAAVVALVVPLSFVDVSHGFSLSLAVCPAGSSQLQQFSTGARVQLTWDEPDGSSVHMTIQQGSQAFYDVMASGGSYSFTADGHPYQFVVNPEGGSCTALPVLVSGTWSAPIL
jgi:hypothetical protein